MKKIIGFSLWGDNPKYTVGAIKNIELASTIYPEWICRFYIGQSTPESVKEEIRKFKNAEIIEMDVPGDHTGMFWRFYPASDPDVSVMISRDCDSRLNTREMEAVNEWLASDNMFHIMRDHPNHGVPILGGMWGVKNPVLHKMKDWIDKFNKGDYWQVDQNFLRDKIFPIIQNNSMIHDEFFDKKPFPMPREGKQFVGEPFDEFDNPNEHYRNLI